MNGFLLVDKPEGPTSHDVVDMVRRALKVRKVGHAGTLDPPASGLLIVAVGPATRMLQYVQRQPKTYEARGVLGVTTSTLDAAGEVIQTRDVDVSEARLREVLTRMTGPIDQVPPAVSAVKVGGERAYKRAARGESVHLEARRVHVYELDLVSCTPPSFDVRVRCSSGTYVRTLVADIGEQLGCGAHVASLRRTAIGPIDVQEAVAVDEIQASGIISVERVLADMPAIRLDTDAARRARSGQRLPAGQAPQGECLVVGPDGPIGVFEVSAGVLRPLTVLGQG